MPNHYYIMAAESLSEVETVAQVITKSHPVGFGRALHRLRGVTLHQAKNSVHNIPLGIDVGDHIYATKTNFIDVATASGWYYDSEGHQII